MTELTRNTYTKEEILESSINLSDIDKLENDDVVYYYIVVDSEIKQMRLTAKELRSIFRAREIKEIKEAKLSIDASLLAELYGEANLYNDFRIKFEFWSERSACGHTIIVSELSLLCDDKLSISDVRHMSEMLNLIRNRNWREDNYSIRCYIADIVRMLVDEVVFQRRKQK